METMIPKTEGNKIRKGYLSIYHRQYIESVIHASNILKERGIK